MSRKKFSYILPLLTIAVFGAGILLGWSLKQVPAPTTASPAACLRLPGGTYTRPLLTCETSASQVSAELQAAQTEIATIIDRGIRTGDVSAVSVHLRKLLTREEINVFPEEKFFPASLKKVPLMMQYFKESEANPGFLDQKVTITDPRDYNKGAAILPSRFPTPGNSYTNRELLDYMITESDNNSFQTLLPNLGYEKFNLTYENMSLNYPDNIVAIDDYMTAKQFGLFFRTLFNTTYLNEANSEAALGLLAASKYDKGLRAGVPIDVPIARKFGVGVVDTPTDTENGELHDCGIVYAKDNPYLLCVMTKSKSVEISDPERVIADISKAAYTNITR